MLLTNIKHLNDRIVKKLWYKNNNKGKKIKNNKVKDAYFSCYLCIRQIMCLRYSMRDFKSDKII